MGRRLGALGFLLYVLLVRGSNEGFCRRGVLVSLRGLIRETAEGIVRCILFC